MIHGNALRSAKIHIPSGALRTSHNSGETFYEPNLLNSCLHFSSCWYGRKYSEQTQLEGSQFQVIVCHAKSLREPATLHYSQERERDKCIFSPLCPLCTIQNPLPWKWSVHNQDGSSWDWKNGSLFIKALDALSEDWGSTPSTHMEVHNHQLV